MFCCTLNRASHLSHRLCEWQQLAAAYADSYMQKAACRHGDLWGPDSSFCWGHPTSAWCIYACMYLWHA